MILASIGSDPNSEVLNLIIASAVVKDYGQ